MELNREQKEKLKNKLISFSEELGGIIENKGIVLNIPLESNYNNHGGLMFKIYKNYFGYETNKTRFVTIFDTKYKAIDTVTRRIKITIIFLFLNIFISTS